ncbi:MAG: hypothetical protein V2A54_09200 [Bacteroidota bacterium]
MKTHFRILVNVFCKSLIALFILALTFSFPSCKKYEDGPAFSLSSKKSRLCGNAWKVDKVFKGDQDYTDAWKSTAPSYYISYSTDGTYFAMWDFQSSEGEWELDYDKKYLVRHPYASGEVEFEIISLKRKQLRLYYEDGDLLFWFIPD